MNIGELREELKQRGLGMDGPKKILLARLEAAGTELDSSNSLLAERLSIRNHEAKLVLETFPGAGSLSPKELGRRLTFLTAFLCGPKNKKALKTQKSVKTFIMAHPKVLRYSADDFESRVSLLQDILVSSSCYYSATIGWQCIVLFTHFGPWLFNPSKLLTFFRLSSPSLQPGIEIRGVIQRQPTLLGLDPATILKPNLDRLGEMLNSSAKDVLRVVKHEPSLLAYDSQVLESKLGVLAQMFNFTVLKTGSLVASRAPGLLTLSIESNLRPSFEALQELLPANKHQIVRSAPSLLAYSEGKLREKVT